jgi:RNA polymerase subunit RPABC4/transcription elongation factor Spt4
MPKSDGNKTGLIILMVIFVAAFLLINPLFRFSCSRVFMHDFLGMHPGDLTPGVFVLGPGHIPLAIMFVLWAAVAVWVYRDAERRNHNGLLWSLFVFIGNIVGLIVYLILRSSSPETAITAAVVAAAQCPSCGGAIQESYVACPHCGVGLSKDCSQCGKRVEKDWKVCPYCGNTLDG